MPIFTLWMIIVIVVTVSRVKKATRQSQGSDSRGVNTQVNASATRNESVRSNQRSFVAMPPQERAIPNVERDCRADDKHRFENSYSNYSKKKLTAIPNVQSTRMRPQPRKSDNRKIARQLYIGDVVPKGMRAVECSYCAADNLVPYGARNEYKCYFCHYDI